MEKSQSSNSTLLNKNLLDFISQIDSLNGTMPFVMALIDINHKAEYRGIIDFTENHSIDKEITDIKDAPDSTSKKESVLSIKVEDYMVFNSLIRNAVISTHSKILIPQSLFVSLISQFDAFLGSLIKIIFKIHPEKLFSSEKNIPFNKLNEFKSIDEIQDYVIEKEVESVIRESHTYHFEWLEKKLSTSLRSDLPIWKTYIEITERRNLFVHNSGKVSSQYINICTINNCDISNIKIGDKLFVSQEYFNNSYKCLYELSVKLSHVIWRKLIPQDLEFADSALNNLCYELIHKEMYELADILLVFSTETIKKHYDEALKNYFLINKALSKYLGGNIDEAKKIINGKDWSATSTNFKLAVNTILECYNEVYKLMEQIGTTGDIPKHAYQIWPLFNKIRVEVKFQEVFKKVFLEDYKIIERPSPAIAKIIDSLTNEENTKSKKKRKPATLMNSKH